MHAIKNKIEILFWGSPGVTECDEVQTPLAASAGITGNSSLPTSTDMARKPQMPKCRAFQMLQPA